MVLLFVTQSMIPELLLKDLGSILCRLDTRKDLCQCALVNSTFYQASIPLLYNYPTEPLCQWDESSLIVPLLNSFISSPQLGQSVRRLDFGQEETVDTIMSVLKYTPLINNLALRSIRQESNVAILHLILPLCPALETLCLFDCDGTSATDPVDWNLSNLRALDISHCHQMSAFESLFASCAASLTTLTLTLVSDWTALTALSRLTRLELTHCTIDTDFILHAQFPFLTQCCFVSCDVASVLLLFFQAHPLLNNVVMNHCQLDDSILSGIELPRLVHLDLSYNGHVFCSQTIRQLILSAPDLRTVYLDECYLPTHDFAEVQPSDEYIWRLFSGDIHRIRSNVQDVTEDILHEWKLQWVAEEAASWQLYG